MGVSIRLHPYPFTSRTHPSARGGGGGGGGSGVLSVAVNDCEAFLSGTNIAEELSLYLSLKAFQREATKAN